jgi:hypothetical protein
MRKYLVSMAILVGIFLSLSIANSALAQSPIEGDWVLNFFWEDYALDAAGNESITPQSTTSLVINMDNNWLGTFTTGDGGEGKVLFFRRIGRIFLIYETGCLPIYWGKMDSPERMSGEMKCREGEARGTWNAHRPTPPQASD